MKTLNELGRAAQSYDQINKVVEFMRLAIAIGGSRRMADPIRMRARTFSPRLDTILGDHNSVFEMTPTQLADFKKAAASVGDTVDTSWASPLAAYKVVADAFVESMRNYGAFDALLPFMRILPLHSRTGIITTGFVGGTPGQNVPKPVTKLAVAATTLEENKATVITALTDELLRFEMASVNDLQRELASALAVATDTRFIDILTASATTFGSSGVTAEHIRNDLRAALTLLTTGVRSKLFLIVPPGLAKVLSVLYDEAGAQAFPGALYNGGQISGIPIVVSDAASSTSVLLVDAAQIAASSETVTLSSSNEASLEMDTAPTSPPIASTAYVSLWQMNWRALKAERWFGAARLQATSVVVITSVNWTGGSPG
jgi:hypothetical protein